MFEDLFLHFVGSSSRLDSSPTKVSRVVASSCSGSGSSSKGELILRMMIRKLSMISVYRIQDKQPPEESDQEL